MGNDESEARSQARIRLIEKTRNNKRELLIKEKRNLVTELCVEESYPEIEPLYRVVDLTGEDENAD